MRREAAIRIHFVRGEWQHRAIRAFRRQSFERRDKEADVGHRLFEIGIAGNDVQHDAVRQAMRGGGHVERFGRRREPRHGRRRGVHSAADNSGLEQRAKVE